jgi:hypothetical protein
LKPPKIKKVDQASVFALQLAMQPLKHVNEVKRFMLKQRWHSRLRYDYAGRSLIFCVAADKPGAEGRKRPIRRDSPHRIVVSAKAAS